MRCACWKSNPELCTCRGGAVTRPYRLGSRRKLKQMQPAELDYPFRKSPRIPKYDYSTVNSYFITICTHNKQCIFYSGRRLNTYGMIVEECLTEIPMRYRGYKLDKFVVMPNHIHAIVTIESTDAKNLSYVVGQFKSVTAKLIHRLSPEIDVWQRSFHDHVIRNQARYDLIWNYIDTNPLRWSEDCFYLGP